MTRRTRKTSKQEKGITLIALIVTIIILLILAGVTINMAVNDKGIFSKARTATSAYKKASEDEQTGLDAADKEIAKYEILPGSTLLRMDAPKINVNGLKYADLDGDGEADGIIVADISEDSTDTTTYKGGNPWGSSDGQFSYTKVTDGLKTYSEDKSYKYTNADGSQVGGTLIKCTNNTGIYRYYIISLADYDDNSHYWYKNAYGKELSDYSTFTSNDFGKGQDNTKKMIDRMKKHASDNPDYGEATTGTNADVWNIIEDKVKEGWFVPSRAEWAAFASYLKPSTTNCADYGLSEAYWTSSQSHNYNENNAWCVCFGVGAMASGRVDYCEEPGDFSVRLRLCALM